MLIVTSFVIAAMLNTWKAEKLVMMTWKGKSHPYSLAVVSPAPFRHLLPSYVSLALPFCMFCFVPLFQEPSAPPLNIQAKPLSPDKPTSLKVTWEPPSNINANGEIVGYRLYSIPNRQTSDADARTSDIVGSATNEFEIDNLEVWTDYRIWMRASTGVGDGPASDPIVARTGEDGKYRMAPTFTALHV